MYYIARLYRNSGMTIMGQPDNGYVSAQDARDAIETDHRGQDKSPFCILKLVQRQIPYEQPRLEYTIEETTT